MKISFPMNIVEWHRYLIPVACLLLAIWDFPAALAAALGYVAIIRLSVSFAGKDECPAIPALVLGAGVLFFAGIPALVAHYRMVSDTFDAFTHQNGSEYLAIAVVAWFMLAAGVMLGMRWRFRDRWFVALALLFFGLVKFYYVISFEGVAVSDFRSMLVQADLWVANGLPENSSEGIVTAVHGERILFYLYPIRWLFGTEGNNYQYVNVPTSCLTALVTWGITRKLFGRIAARAALIFALFAIEPLQAAEIPTHDIPGALAVIVAVGLFVVLLSRMHERSGWWWSLLLGVSIQWVELQRSIGFLFVASFAIFVLLLLGQQWLSEGWRGKSDFRRAGKSIAMLLLLPVAVYWLLSTILIAVDLKRPPMDMTDWRAGIVSAHSESWGTGSYGYWRVNWQPRELPPGGELEFVGKRLLSDYYYSPGENLAHYFRKAQRLHAFGAHQGFYLNQGKLRGDQLDQFMRIQLVFLNKVFAAPLLALYVIGMGAFLIYRRRIGGAHFPLLFISMFGGSMILFAEVQSRYLFPIWYIAPIYAGYFLSRWRKSGDGQ